MRTLVIYGHGFVKAMMKKMAADGAHPAGTVAMDRLTQSQKTEQGEGAAMLELVRKQICMARCKVADHCHIAKMPALVRTTCTSRTIRTFVTRPLTVPLWFRCASCMCC